MKTITVTRNLVLFGPPGAGKGTQCISLSRRWNLVHISTGAILREAMRSHEPWAVHLASILSSGGFVGDALITELVRRRFAQIDATQGFLLDGFPRTEPQALALDSIARERPVFAAVELVVPAEEVVRRLAERLVCAGCGAPVPSWSRSQHGCGADIYRRDDDAEDVVLCRYERYESEMMQLRKIYEARGNLVRIDGHQTPERVTTAIVQALDEMLVSVTAQDR